MKLCVAQTRAVKGDIIQNIENHCKLIGEAISKGVDLIIFPELSITGYEPELANRLATRQDDRRFDRFQQISDTNQITIGVGMPTRSDMGIRISTIIFQPDQPRQTYSKQYLHPDEEPYFRNGQEQVFLTVNSTKIALAICYELSVPDHADYMAKHGADIYLASVAKTAEGIEKATKRLAEIASSYSMPVLMANCVGPCDNVESAGNSSIWTHEGVLVGQLNDTDEGILIFDTDTQSIFIKSEAV
ncbi:carbon-nitrogen hydrolase family protein [Spirosoma sp. HMF3257]|uniref:Carbon-nitrogen hydrolase family protein n=1 Tax=Spirosoma telluris TaxID=2183553 RepID=A0A327NEU1_9BACT|nr:carbon-nitrogen hydrolase family protein [Spirosoma telluris]RAI73801.1 carbon-nitrogen hydrolase family protein [Spirosoma telluris]